MSNLSGCGGVGDIGSSTSTSTSAVDNSTDDHSVVGDSQTTVTCKVNEDGSTEFTFSQDGVAVSQESFAEGVKPCPSPEEDSGEADAESSAVVDNSDGEQVVLTGGIPSIPQ